MKERPILFNGAMVRAIRDGRKTVTRRAVSPKLVSAFDVPRGQGDVDAGYPFVECEGGYMSAVELCPFGRVGDRLWVRETFMDLWGTGVEHRPDPSGPLQRYAYAAECPPGSHADGTRKDYGLKWRPSIHMPRAACRLLLEITAVRVERLQAISVNQVRREGCEVREFWLFGADADRRQQIAAGVFQRLWESTGGDWAGNPWVWVVEFQRVQPTPAQVAA